MSEQKRKNTQDGVPAKGRSCKACTQCCIQLEIESKPGYSTRFDTGEDLAKKARVACRYLDEQGCTIYDVRPLVCRQFACDWVLGEKSFKLDDTPLNTGIIGVRGVNWHFDPKNKPRRTA